MLEENMSNNVINKRYKNSIRLVKEATPDPQAINETIVGTILQTIAHVIEHKSKFL